MHTTFNRAYRVDALSLEDKIGLFSGIQPPTAIDTATFPVGSAYFQTDGTVWRRIGVNAADWVRLSVLPFYFFVLADSTVVLMPWVVPGVLAFTLTDGSAGTLTVEI